MNQQELKKIIEKYLEGNITEKEKQCLELLELKVEKINAVCAFNNDKSRMDKVFKKISYQTRSKKSNYTWYAIATLVFVISLGLYFNIRDASKEITVTNNAANAMTIELKDGSQITHLTR
ncbi:MAG: hypothetical protein ACK5H1_08540 [Tenacibaculum sp.]